jgi:hypothetical protein
MRKRKKRKREEMEDAETNEGFFINYYISYL